MIRTFKPMLRDLWFREKLLSEYRNRGFGTVGIELVCKAAKEKGVLVLYDDIAIGNPSYKLF